MDGHNAKRTSSMISSYNDNRDRYLSRLEDHVNRFHIERNTNLGFTINPRSSFNTRNSDLITEIKSYDFSNKFTTKKKFTPFLIGVKKSSKVLLTRNLTSYNVKLLAKNILFNSNTTSTNTLSQNLYNSFDQNVNQI